MQPDCIRDIRSGEKGIEKSLYFPGVSPTGEAEGVQSPKASQGCSAEGHEAETLGCQKQFLKENG